MRKLIVTTFLTLNGVMQAPGGPGEDDSGGFAHGGWLVNYWDEEVGQAMSEAMSAPFDLLLGRKTYDILAAYWPHAADDPGARPLNDATKYVASRSHPTLEWSNSVLIEGDAAEGVAALKQEDGPELQVHGSGDLIQTLLRHNLVDRYRLSIFPLVIGSGKRLFPGGTVSSGLKLTDSKVTIRIWSRDRHLRAGRRDRHRIVRAGLTAPGTHRRARPEPARTWTRAIPCTVRVGLLQEGLRRVDSKR